MNTQTQRKLPSKHQDIESPTLIHSQHLSLSSMSLTPPTLLKITTFNIRALTHKLNSLTSLADANHWDAILLQELHMTNIKVTKINNYTLYSSGNVGILIKNSPILQVILGPMAGVCSIEKAHDHLYHCSHPS